MKNPFANVPPVVAGPVWMVTAGIGYTLTSVCTRELSSDYSTAQLAFMRAVIALGFVAPLILRNGISVMRRRCSRCTCCGRFSPMAA